MRVSPLGNYFFPTKNGRRCAAQQHGGDGERPTIVRLSSGWWTMIGLLLLLASCETFVFAAVNRPISGHKSFPYIYAVKDDPQASFPVLEHLSLRDRPDYVPPGDDGEAFDTEDRPDFLYDENIDTYRMVEFYVHWCDICKSFKPHYIHLATRVRELARQQHPHANVTVHAYAISCAPNRPLCRSLAVDRYPAFRLYRPGDVHGVELPTSQVNPVKVLEALGLSIDGVDEGDENKWDSSLLEDWGGHSSPTTIVSQSWLNWGRSQWDQIKILWGTQHPSSLQLRDKFAAKRTRDELRDDVHLSFDYAMRQGVFMSNDPLTNDRAQCLKDWFMLLRQTLPPSWKRLHAVVDDLVVNFDYVRRSEGYLTAYLDQYPPPQHLWSQACSHGDPDAGYSCGLWSTFHVVTVGVVDHNVGTAFEENMLKTEAVARTIRNYIDQFFGCAGCRRHFITAYDFCAHDRCHRLLDATVGTEADWKELPLWLLETHNSVNIRLMKEAAARANWVPTYEDERAVTWPLVSDCPRCWEDGGGGPTDRSLQANKDILYKFLKLEYGQRDGRASEFKKEIFAKAPVVATADEQVLVSASPLFNLPAIHIPEVDIWKPIQKVALTIWRHLPEIQPPRRGLTDLEVDVHFSFDYAMRHDVYEGDKSLSDEKIDLLWVWFNLLMRLLPSRWSTLHLILDELTMNFGLVVQSVDYAVSILDKFPMKNDELQPRGSCTRHKHVFDQYSCGLWELFHVITVGVVHHNSLVATSAEECFFPKNVAWTIRDYTLMFYDQARFGSTTDLCASGACDHLVSEPGSLIEWMDLPIWLFERHNSLNVQLIKEKADRENKKPEPSLVIGARWPDNDDCPTCWIVKGKWSFSHDNVYKYLLLQYGPRNALTDGLEKELGLEPKLDFVARVQEFTEDSWVAKVLCGLFCRSDCGKRTEKQLEADVSLALHAMMRHGVYKNDDDLTNNKKAVLSDLLLLLEKTLPNSWVSIHLLLRDMLDNFMFVATRKDYLFAILDENAPNQTKWSSVCAAESDNPESLSCGVWTMLHVASVGTVRYNRNVDSMERISAGSAALTISDAVDSFSNCNSCRPFFSAAFESCDHGRCDTLSMKVGEESEWAQLPLWLSKVHNTMNLRGKRGDAAEAHRSLSRDDEIDALWPAREDCDCCWDEDGNPNDEVTFRYLEYMYGINGPAAVPKLSDEL